MKIEIEIGGKKYSAGTAASLRGGQYGELIVASGKPKYAELAVNGKLFIGANPSGTPVTTQAGVSTTTPALTLYNPVNSGVKMILNTFTLGIYSSPAANTQFFLAYNADTAAAPSSVTAATIVNALVGTSLQPKGKCYAIATLAASPIACRYIGGVTGASSISPNTIIDKIDGEIVLMPGVAVSIQSTAAASILASCSWYEEEL